jgi:D-aminoacyl-tRNA deacylase
MRAVVQRVRCASIEVDGSVIARTDGGILVLLGIGRNDVESGDGSVEAKGVPADQGGVIFGRVTAMLAEKVANLRIFPDAAGRSNFSLREIGGQALVVSQFTLYADCRRGRRPSFTGAADPLPAERLVEGFCRALEELGVATARGRFGAHMTIALVNDGPYTILLDTETLGTPRSGRGSS